MPNRWSGVRDVITRAEETGVEIGVAIMPPDGGAFSHRGDDVFLSASTIKIAVMVEREPQRRKRGVHGDPISPARYGGESRQVSMADEFNAMTPGGDAQILRAEALGEPGQRRFRLVTVIDGETYVLWMEKQQVQALGLALEQLVEHLPPSPGFGAGDPTAIINEDTRNQFRVGRIEIAFDEALEQIVLAAHDIDQDDDTARPSLTIRISREIGRALSEEAAELVAKGRPFCPMCGSPMDIGRAHVCPQQNGHLPLTFSDELF